MPITNGKGTELLLILTTS